MIYSDARMRLVNQILIEGRTIKILRMRLRRLMNELQSTVKPLIESQSNEPMLKTGAAVESELSTINSATKRLNSVLARYSYLKLELDSLPNLKRTK